MRTACLLLAVCIATAEAWSLFGGDDSEGKKKKKKVEEEVDAGSYDEPSEKVVGARIETCRGCRLNYLPRVRNFISSIADQFPALSVKFIHGAPPDILWLNEFGQEVGRHHLDDYSEKGIEKLLKEHSITRKTKAPTFKSMRFKPTANCQAFRGHDNCDPEEARVMGHDRSCSQLIGDQMAGFCECKGFKLTVQCGEREHLPLTCEALCDDIADGDVLMTHD